MNNYIGCHDGLDFITSLKFDTIDLIYVDPPFNTGKKRKLSKYEYKDKFDDYLGFLRSYCEYFHLILKGNGSLLLHLDYREVHYVKCMLDKIFGRECFMNEIIWCYDYGGRAKKKYSCKHDTILWYVVDPNEYTFNYDQLARVPYMAPGLAGPEKAKRGKTIVDWQFHTIVPTMGTERVGYPTQKPLGLIERFIKVHSNEGDLVLDCFCGSGTTGVAAKKYNRNFMLCDNNPDAINITKERLRKIG